MKAKRIMGLDLSLRSTAAVVVPSDWGRDWRKLRSHVAGYRLDEDAVESVRLDRMISIAKHLIEFAIATRPDDIFVANYAFGQVHRSHWLGELGGIVKLHLRAEVGIQPTPLVESSARKFLVGRIPRGKRRKKGEPKGPKMPGAKQIVGEHLKSLGAKFKTNDEADAFVIANFGMAAHGLPAIEHEDSSINGSRSK